MSHPQGGRLFLGPSSHEILRFQDIIASAGAKTDYGTQANPVDKTLQQKLFKSRSAQEESRATHRGLPYGLWVWSQHNAQVRSPAKQILAALLNAPQSCVKIRSTGRLKCCKWTNIVWGFGEFPVDSHNSPAPISSVRLFILSALRIDHKVAQARQDVLSFSSALTHTQHLSL